MLRVLSGIVCYLSKHLRDDGPLVKEMSDSALLPWYAMNHTLALGVASHSYHTISHLVTRGLLET